MKPTLAITAISGFITMALFGLTGEAHYAALGCTSALLSSLALIGISKD